MHPFTLLFLTAVLAALGLQLWLLHRQIRAVGRQREHLPTRFAPHIGVDDHRRAADYARDRARFARVEATTDTLLLLAWTLGGGIALVDAMWRGFELGPIATGTGVIASVLLASALVGLPLRAWRLFVIEERYGFNRMTARQFASDCLRGGLLSLSLALPLLALVLALMHVTGSGWWFWVWALWMAFNAALLWAWPRFLAPLFNRFEPLPDDALRARLERLVARCGFRSDGIQVVDGSRRSSHANAYFTGIGRSRRIVFYDTLLQQLAPHELEAVLAHELGHFRHGHVRRMMLLSAGTSLVGLALLAGLMQQPWFYHALGVPVASVHTALLLFLLGTPVVALFLRPLVSRLSRRHEFEADTFAARHCPPEHLISALTTLYRENAGTLTPDPLYAAFHDSHPPAGERIDHLQAQTKNP